MTNNPPAFLKLSLHKRRSLILSLMVLALTTSLVNAGGEKSAEPELTNPVPFSIASIKQGKQLYARHCVLCHGPDGNGDTQMREFLKTHPADFTDSEWVYGNSDAVLFDVIKHGREEKDMPAFPAITDQRIWSVIHYVRFLNGERP